MKSLLCLLYAFITLNSIAQSHFYKKYTGTSASHSSFVHKTPDLGYVVCSCSSGGPTIQKYDQCGTLSWTKSYPFPGGDVTVCKNGTMLLTSNYYTAPKLLKLDQFGNVLWSYEFSCNGYQYYVYSNGEFDNGDIFFSGAVSMQNNSPANHFIIKLDSTGVVKWSKSYPFSSWGYAIPCSDGGVLSKAGHTSFKTDAAGNLEWEKQYMGTSFSIKPIEVRDGFIFARYGEISTKDTSYLYKIDKQGNLLWIGQRFHANYLCGVSVLPNGNYLTVGSLRMDPSTFFMQATVIEVDTLGNFVRQSTYKPHLPGSTTRGENACQLNARTTILVGREGTDIFTAQLNSNYSFGCGDSSITQFYPPKNVSTYSSASTAVNLAFTSTPLNLSSFPRTLSEFTKCSSYDSLKVPAIQSVCLTSGSAILQAPIGYKYLWSNGDTTSSIIASTPGIYQVHITDECINHTVHSLYAASTCVNTGLMENENAPDPSIFPNPSTGHVSVRIYEVIETKISIYDLTGSIVKTALFKNEVYSIDLSDQPKGIYFIKVENANRSFARKLIIQ